MKKLTEWIITAALIVFDLTWVTGLSACEWLLFRLGDFFRWLAYPIYHLAKSVVLSGAFLNRSANVPLIPLGNGRVIALGLNLLALLCVGTSWFIVRIADVPEWLGGASTQVALNIGSFIDNTLEEE